MTVSYHTVHLRLSDIHVHLACGSALYHFFLMAFFASCQQDFHQISLFSEHGVLCKVTAKHSAILPCNKHAVALHLMPHIMCKIVVLKRSVCTCGCNTGCHSVPPTVSSPNTWRHSRLLLFHIAFNVLSLPGKREHGVLCSETLRFQMKWWKMFPQSSAWNCFKVFVEKHICSLKFWFLSTYGSKCRLPMKTGRCCWSFFWSNCSFQFLISCCF